MVFRKKSLTNICVFYKNILKKMVKQKMVGNMGANNVSVDVRLKQIV